MRILLTFCLLATALTAPVAAAPASVVVTNCTNAGLQAALDAGGLITFNCAVSPTTIIITTTLQVSGPSATVDGGGTVTLQGSNTRILRQRTEGFTASTLTLRNLTFTQGRAIGPGTAANGAAIQSINQSAGQDYWPRLILENVTFTNNVAQTTSFGGNAYDYGGAVYSSGGLLYVSNSLFQNNAAPDAAGGAIHILRSSLRITDSTFIQNSALGSVPANSQGGAIYIDGLWPEQLELSISGSSFISNTAFNSGGAIYFNLYENAGGLTVDTTRFIGNAVVGGSQAQGGAISGGGTTIGGATGNPPVTISRSLFAHNSVQKSAAPIDGSGGALAFAQRTTLSITNATFYGNRAEGTSFNANGGALYILNHVAPFQLNHVTFANNYAGWVGGAITGSNGELRNTVFANNSAANGGQAWNIQQTCSSELVENGHNLQYPPRNTNPNTFNEVTCFQGKSTIAQRTLPDFQNPLLGPLADNGGGTQTLSIGPGSPAYNAAEAATCAAVDQRGVARPQGAGCDMGAYERVAALALVPALVEAGGPDFNLQVTGEGFTPTSQVLWNGTPLPTTFLNSTALEATVDATLIAAPGSVPISVSASALPAVNLVIVAELHQAWLPVVRR